jgi:HSP20 family molecular chaperone IbpA
MFSWDVYTAYTTGAWQANDNGWEIKIPVSGANKEDFDVSLIDNELSLSFDGNEFAPIFKKRWTVPKGVKTKHISAKYEAGVLTLSVEKPKDFEQKIKVE